MCQIFFIPSSHYTKIRQIESILVFHGLDINHLPSFVDDLAATPYEAGPLSPQTNAGAVDELRIQIRILHRVRKRFQRIMIRMQEDLRDLEANLVFRVEVMFGPFDVFLRAPCNRHPDPTP